MFLKHILLLTLINLSIETENVTNNIYVVVNLIKKQGFPGTMNAYVCWTKDQKLKLWKICSDNFIPTKIMKTRTMLNYCGPKNQQFFLVDLDCEGSRSLLKQSENAGLFRNPFRWIILESNMASSSLREYFFGMDSNVYVIKKVSTEYLIKMPYKFTLNDTSIIENHVATWKHMDWINFNKITVPRNRSNLMKTQFRVSYAFEDPDSLNHLYDYRNPHIDTISKSSYLLVEYLMASLNVTIEPPKFYKSRGYKQEGSEKYGYMMGDIQRNEVDISDYVLFFGCCLTSCGRIAFAGAGLPVPLNLPQKLNNSVDADVGIFLDMCSVYSPRNPNGTISLITIERMKIQDFIYPSTHSAIRFVFRAPLLSSVTNIFTVPFDRYVWYASFVLVFTVLLILYVIVRWEWLALKIKNEHVPVLTDNILDVFVTELGAITQQGTETEPRSVSGRIAMLFSFVAFMFLYNAYCANIVAVLQSTSDSIRTVKDLYTSDISLGAENITYSIYFFKRENHPMKKALVEEKLKYMNAEEGIRRVKSDFFAFHSETSTIYKIVGETFTPGEICNLRGIKFFNYIPPFFSVPVNSTYKELLKYRLGQMRESGIVSREQRRLFAEKPKCLNQGSFGSVGIVECYAAYVIFGIGIGCSGGLLLLEIFCETLKRRHIFN